MIKILDDDLIDKKAKQDYLLKSIHVKHLNQIRRLSREKNRNVAGAVEFLVEFYEFHKGKF